MSILLFRIFNATLVTILPLEVLPSRARAVLEVQHKIRGVTGSVKQRSRISKAIFVLLVCMITFRLKAQQGDCVLLPPVVNIDFGSGNVADINPGRLPKYKRDFTTCPADGFYAYASHTSECFNGDWLTFNTDHTTNVDGNMMVVNASETGGIFFNTGISGLKPNTTYQFAAWMVNVCREDGGCSPLPPNITITLSTTGGKTVAEFVTGLLAQNDVPRWKKYFGFFVSPAEVSTLIITMEDKTLGGCGNDFALDDITFCECIKPAPLIQKEHLPVARPGAKQSFPVSKPAPKKTPVKTSPAKKDTPVSVTKRSLSKIPVITLPPAKEKPVTTSIPQPILTRENPIVKRIETGSGEITIDLYDNGEIDGDTVSIYHNNELIVSRAGLSDKPIHFSLQVDTIQPHHELVMVANNLGSIPPNTSVMIITVNNKRFEVYISSSEQKNAKVVIDLKE